MGELLRKFACKRLLAMDQPNILAVTTDMRQYGNAPGGAESIIHFKQCIRALHAAGKLSDQVCMIDIDETNFFGSLEWKPSAER